VVTKIHSYQNQENFELPTVSIELTELGQGPMKGNLSHYKMQIKETWLNLK
jgi:hypothetical protein